MKQAIVFLMLMLALAVSGCTDRAKELYDTAKLEELQNNPEHARKLYREIVADYPGSEYAAKAKDRLEDLEIK